MSAGVSLRGARVLGTGASGFIGSHLVARLERDGAMVHAVSRSAEGSAGSRWWRIDLADAERVAALVAAVEPMVIFHVPVRPVRSRPGDLGRGPRCRRWDADPRRAGRGASIAEIAGRLVPPVLAAAVATAAILPLEHLVLRSDGHGTGIGLALLVVDAVAFAAVYLMALGLVAPSGIRDLVQAAGRWRARRAAQFEEGE